MQLLDVSPLAARCSASYWSLLGPAWLVLVMEETEWAKPVVLYQLLPLPSGQFPKHLAEPGGVHGRTPHYFLEHTRPAVISLARPLPVDPRHVHSRCTCLSWLCGLFVCTILKGSSPSTSGAPCWRLSCGHVQGIPPFLVHEVPESLLNGLPHPDRPFLCPLAPICRGHLAEDAGQRLVVNQTTEQPAFLAPIMATLRME
jgi:hypothetical protein